MAPALLNYLGFGSTATTPASKEKTPVRALPASWYTSQQMYDLERRAIFSRKWLLITHEMRIAQPGDFLKYSVAGFEFVLCRDREGKVNAFHNVCRHRAFPVVSKESGNAKILACKYHGWSYGLNGKLAKAPHYQEMEGFDKDANGLFPIHVRIDHNGFIWINMDNKEAPEVPWEEDFGGVDLQERYKLYNFKNYEFDHAWDMDVDYNWKIAADNFNECYHCPTTHPSIGAFFNVDGHIVDTEKSFIMHDAGTTPEQEAQGLKTASTYYFPNVSMVVSPHFLFVQRFEPLSPRTTSIRYEVFRNKHSSEEDFQCISANYKQVMLEDKDLCIAVQRNINAGTFVSGELHAKKEKGPLFIQGLCRDVVQAHWKREQAARREIWPARQMLPAGSSAAEEDEEFCSGLACQTDQRDMAW